MNVPSAKKPPHPLVLILFILLVCILPMTKVLPTSSPPRVMESISISSAEETWMRQQGTPGVPRDPYSWWHPSWGDHPRLVKPPLVVWLNMLSWTGLDAANTPSSELIFRARILALVMTSITLIAVFAIGTMLEDEWLGLLAALIMGTFWFMQREGRTDAYDIHMTAWYTVAVAWALWAMRPFGELPPPRRRMIGWLLAGVFFGAAIMSKGPLSLLLVAVGTGSLIGIAPRDRGQHLRGAAVMLLVAAALTLPWYLYTGLRTPNAFHHMFNEYEAHRDQFQVPWYYIGVLALVMPWTLWFMAGFVQPFTKKESDERRRRLFVWFWFLILFVFFSIPEAKQQRYILPLMPAAALVAAQVLRDHETLARLGQPDRGSRFLYTPQWLAMLLASLLIGPLLLKQDWFLRHKIVSEPMVGSLSVGAVLVLVVLTVPLACLGWFWHRRGLVVRAGVTAAVWMAVFSSFVWTAYGRLPKDDISAEPQRVAALTAGRHVFCIMPDDPTKKPINRDAEFIIFSGRLYDLVTPADFHSHHNPIPEGDFLITEAKQEEDEVISEDGGLVKVTDFVNDGRHFHLWRSEAAATRPATTQ